MKFGIYYAYWEKEWGGDCVPYIKKCSKLGFDVLEVPCGDFHTKPESYFKELKNIAEAHGMLLSGGYGPRPEHNLASTDTQLVENAFKFYGDVFNKMALADMAANHGITLCMESLNRFEGYMINEAYEDVDYVKAVDKPNVKSMLDTFHMNIEEDSIVDAIRLTKGTLGNFHVGEANRKCPGPGSRMNWEAIGDALKEIGYDGYVIMEPFVRMGGKVGQDISIWRDISKGATIEQLDKDAADSVAYLKKVFK